MLDSESVLPSSKRDELSELRRKRIFQISNVTSLGLIACLFVSRGITFDIFAISLFVFSLQLFWPIRK